MKWPVRTDELHEQLPQLSLPLHRSHRGPRQATVLKVEKASQDLTWVVLASHTHGIECSFRVANLADYQPELRVPRLGTSATWIVIVGQGLLS